MWVAKLSRSSRSSILTSCNKTPGYGQKILQINPGKKVPQLVKDFSFEENDSDKLFVAKKCGAIPGPKLEIYP